MAQSKPIAQGIDITERRQAEKALSREKNFPDAIINSLPGLLFVIGDKGNTIQWNRNVEKVTGYSAKEIAKMNVLDFVAKEDQKTAAEAIQEVLTKGQSSVEINVLSKPGKKTPFHITGLCTKFENATCVVCTGIDITERKQTEEALRKSEERFRVLFEQAADCILLLEITPEGIPVIRDANNATFRLLGYERDEVIGQPVSFMEPAPDASKVIDERRKDVLSASGTTIFEARHRCKDGTIRDFECSVTEMQIGSKTLAISVERDITERKKAEARLRQSEERYRTILESIEDGYYEIDLSGNFTFFNDVTCAHLGYPREQLIGMNNRQYTDEKTAKKLYHLYVEVYNTGKPLKGFVYERIRKDGTKWFSEVSISLIRDAQGKPIGFRGISRDVTERKRAEHQLRKRMNELRAFYSLAAITEREDITLDKLYQELTNILPQSWQYPEIACARIVIGDSEFCTVNFAESPWKQSAPVKVHGSVVGRIEVGYLEERPEEDKGPFMKEERQLIDAIAERLGHITERKRTEEKLLQSEERYRTIIENIQDGYFEDDLAGKFTFVNDVICKHLGYTKEELIGTDNRLYQDETNAQKAHQAFEEVYETGEPVKALDMEIIRKDGTKRISEVSVSLIRDVQGKPIGFRGISRDITERKQAAELLQRYAAELERNNEEVKNFAYIVSHDLRVPLVNLKGYTSELRTALGVIGANFDAALPHLNDEKRSAVAMALHEDVPEALEFITNSVTRMDSFINAVLILARLGRQDLKPEPIDMNALVQTTVETMSHQLQERGIEVIVGSLPQVIADRTSMEQIMGNILGNAVKYLDSSRPGRIEVTAQANGAETAFRIRDNGRGIAAEDMAKVFAPFRRAGKQDTPGEGMGLAYVQTLLRRHGGRISCESELGKGTTFTFTISTRPEKGARDA